MPTEKKTIKKTPAKKPAVKKSTPKMDKNDFAVIETGGKQYLVYAGDKLKIEKVKKPARGTAVSFDKVLLVSIGKTLKIGTPYIASAKVKATWVDEKKGKKITMVRYKSKTRHHRKKGHRQIYSEVVIDGF